jgi:hypothetical protein
MNAVLDWFHRLFFGPYVTDKTPEWDEPDTLSYESELDLLVEVNAHLDDGRKGYAIGAYREAFRVDLKKSKAAVEAMCLERNGTTHP